MEALVDLEMGDWKTALAHPGRWPTIPKGTQVEKVGEFDNLYGHFIRVKGPNGQIYDVEHYKVSQ